MKKRPVPIVGFLGILFTVFVITSCPAELELFPINDFDQSKFVELLPVHDGYIQFNLDHELYTVRVDWLKIKDGDPSYSEIIYRPPGYPLSDKFIKSDMSYKATITLTAKPGTTFAGIDKNKFFSLLSGWTGDWEITPAIQPSDVVKPNNDKVIIKVTFIHK